MGNADGESGDTGGNGNGGSPPPDPRLEELKKELARAEIEAEIATQHAELLTKLFPKAEPKAREGTVTVGDEVAIESTVLAYRELKSASAAVGARVARSARDVVVVHGDEPARQLADFRLFQEEVDVLEELWTSVTPEDGEEVAEPEMAIGGLVAGVGAVLSTVSLGAKAILDLAAFTRKDVTVEGVEVEIPDRTLVATVADALVDAGVQARVPQLAPDPGRDPAVKDALVRIREARSTALSRAERDGDGKLEDSRVREVLAAHDAFEKGLVEVDDDAGQSRLADLLAGAALARSLEEGASFLRVWMAAAGGTNRTEKGFRKGDVHHGGGVVVGFLLSDGRGAVKAADVIARHSGYHKEIPGS